MIDALFLSFLSFLKVGVLVGFLPRLLSAPQPGRGWCGAPGCWLGGLLDGGGGLLVACLPPGGSRGAKNDGGSEDFEHIFPREAAALKAAVQSMFILTEQGNNSSTSLQSIQLQATE